MTKSIPTTPSQSPPCSVCGQTDQEHTIGASCGTYQAPGRPRPWCTCGDPHRGDGPCPAPFCECKQYVAIEKVPEQWYSIELHVNLPREYARLLWSVPFTVDEEQAELESIIRTALAKHLGVRDKDVELEITELETETRRAK